MGDLFESDDPGAAASDRAAVDYLFSVTYEELPSGDRDANIRSAIACYEAVLGVDTEAKNPVQWAATLNNLGNAYLDLGRSQDAMASFRAALELDPMLAEARLNCGIVLLASGNT